MAIHSKKHCFGLRRLQDEVTMYPTNTLFGVLKSYEVIATNRVIFRELWSTICCETVEVQKMYRDALLFTTTSDCESDAASHPVYYTTTASDCESDAASHPVYCTIAHGGQAAHTPTKLIHTQCACPASLPNGWRVDEWTSGVRWSSAMVVESAPERKAYLTQAIFVTSRSFTQYLQSSSDSCSTW